MSLKFIQTNNNVKFTRRELLIGFSALLITAVYFIFPAKLTGEWFLINLLLFLVFPALIIRLILRENLKNFGFAAGNFRTGILMGGATAIIFSLLIYFLLSYPNFRSGFSFYLPAASSFWSFLWFDFFIGGAALFTREFFLRGFFQTGLESGLGRWAILAQAILDTVLSAKSSWIEISILFLFGLAGGFTTFKSRSFFWSFAAMWIIFLAGDIMIIRMLGGGI